MQKIKNLEDMYKLMETLNSNNYSEIKGRINSFLKETVDEETKKAILCEHTCLEFRIIDAKIEGLFTIVNDDGKLINIPNLDNLSDKDFEYIENRMNSVNNPFLKFRYSSILCNKYPHIDKAKICSDSSFEFINNLEKDVIENQSLDSFFIITIINSYRFSFKFEYKKNRIKNKIIEIINNEGYWNNEIYLVPFKLIQHISDEKKNFREITNLNAICWNIYENISSLDPRGAIEVLELGEKTDTNSQQYNWRLEIGKMYEVLMNQNNNTNIKAEFCILASQNYKQAGAKSKAEILLKEYEKFPADFKYFRYSDEIENYPEKRAEVLDYADYIVENSSSYEIFLYLMDDPILTRHYKYSWEFVKKLKIDCPLLYSSSKVLRDKRGFPIKNIVSNEDKDNHEAMQYYSRFISIFYLPFITRIINTAYIKGKLSTEIVLNFLKEETWLGWDVIPNVGSNPYFMMIVPIINNYFYELELFYLYNIQHPNFILFIDSVILKIEGMLNLVYSIDNTIKEPTDDGATQNKSLNNLFENGHCDLISEANLFFLEFLLIDKSGLNLRNKVAHSLMNKEDYYLGNANLLLLALFKICAFKLDLKNNDKI